MKKLYIELDIIKLHKQGISLLPVGRNEILTPLALDKIKEFGMTIDAKTDVEIITPLNENSKLAPLFKVAVGCDHTGFKLKNVLIKILMEKGFKVLDMGTFDEKSCDYPDYALSVAEKVKMRLVTFGIIIDATGNPSAITANKLAGIRAANCYNEFTAKSARKHNNANILTLGAKSIGEETAKSILDSWLNSNFAGGRHQRRLDKITAVEKKYLK